MKITPSKILKPRFSFSGEKKLLSPEKNTFHKTKVMGIINMTPDSFSQDGCFNRHNASQSLTKAVQLAKKQIRDGADIIDIGGESSRPGSRRITSEEEINRILPLLKKLKKETAAVLSVDTYKSSVAEKALDNGAVIINNIKGIKPEKYLLKLIAKYDASIVLMHSIKTPLTMQKNIQYNNLIDEIYSSLKTAIMSCEDAGISHQKIIIDPGIGFGKTVEHNLEILNRLHTFKNLKKQILIGTSRKSFIGKILEKDADKRLYGTIATVCAAVINGADIVRVHDVKPVKEAVSMIDAVLNQKPFLKESAVK